MKQKILGIEAKDSGGLQLTAEGKSLGLVIEMMRRWPWFVVGGLRPALVSMPRGIYMGAELWLLV